MNNITLDCPVCDAEEKVVGNPEESTGGHQGKWYCFVCGSHGIYHTEFEVIGKVETTEDADIAPGVSGALPDAHPDPDPDYQETP